MKKLIIVLAVLLSGAVLCNLIVDAIYRVEEIKEQRVRLRTYWGGTINTSAPLHVNGTVISSATVGTMGVVDSNPVMVRFKADPPVLRPPVDHPPLLIVIGKFTYRVRYTTEDYLNSNACVAFSDLIAHEIWLDPERKLKDQQDDLLHELLHIALAQAGGKNPEFTNDDEFVLPMTPELLKILRNNPRTLAWILKR